jgi:phosphate starvation-inducible protein PhoH
MSRRERKRKASNFRRDNVYDLTQALHENGKAAAEGPQRKTWSQHDLRTIRPMTPRQEEMFYDFFAGNNICAVGSAGTGKTYIALYLALVEVLDPKSPIDKIIIVRSAVPAREIGFLPGTEEEKTAVYEAPYKPMFHDFIGRASTYDDMKKAGLVEFMTTSYIRGMTWDNAIVVVDEIQNFEWSEFDTVATRLGENSRIILAGDGKHQQDLKSGKSGFSNMIRVVEYMDNFTIVDFLPEDIVRSGFVKEWITARDALGL